MLRLAKRIQIVFIIIIVLAVLLAGCGGGGSSKSPVAQVTLGPTTVSLNSGDTAALTFSAVNAQGGAPNPLPTFTFNSSDVSVVTVKADGTVCAGVWDSNFVVCKGTDSSGNPIVGSAAVTATAGGVTSAAVIVSVHAKVTSVVVSAASGCTSMNQTQAFTAVACSTQATPHDAGPPCGPSAKDITSRVGTFGWNTSDATVASVVSTGNSAGLATARVPGLTGVIATVSDVNSPAQPLGVCMPNLIRLHVVGDPPGTPTTSANMNPTQTLALQADMVDTNNVTVPNVPVSFVSNRTLVASMSANTLTANSFGGAGIEAACTPPVCGRGINTPVYSNLFRVTVAGASPSTTVYVTSSFTPPTGTSPTLVPIDTGTNVAGTAITLPGVPNSLVMAASGTKAYMGSPSGLISFDPAANTATIVDSLINGKVLAVSADGNKVILSNAANDPSTGTPIEPNPANQRLWVFDSTNSQVQTFVVAGAVAATFDSDGFRSYIAANNGNVYVFSSSLAFQTLAPGGSLSDVATLASGPFTYVAGGAALNVFSTCTNAAQASPPATSAPQLVGAVANADTIVALNATGLDIETVTVTPPAQPAACPPSAAYSNQFIDFGLGAFTGRQLLVASNGAHVAVLPVGINQVLTAVPGTPGATNITLPAGATEPLSGGMTLDGNFLWAGIAGTNTVDKLDLTAGTDTVQVATSFKKADNSAAPPNLVVIRPK